MQQRYEDTLLLARDQANLQIANPRERAIIIRSIEDALCRAGFAAQLPALTVNEASPPRG